MKPETDEEGSDFEELRRLLLGDDLHKIEQLHTHVEIPENFSSQVGDILPQALVKSSEKGEALSEAMLPTVEEIVRLSIRKDINRFADALFPVIGPAIRKAISETLRQMLQSLNRTLEQSLSWQGIKWRLESVRTGIPFAQIALLNSLVYQVEQVFLIHRESGLLLSHLQHDGSSHQNPDLVSSMLAAINDFVGDSFEMEDNKTLGSVEVGDISIWVEAGPNAILAVAIRGEAPNSLRVTLQQTLEQVQNELDDELNGFSGDTSEFEKRSEILQDCLQAQFQTDQESVSARTWILIVLLLSGLIVWSGYEWRQTSLQNEHVALLEAEPGYVVTQVREKGGVLVVTGLRDPLSREVEVLMQDAPLTALQVDYLFEPYQSLQPEFVELRARRIMNPPDGVNLSVRNNQLHVDGIADLAWRDQLRARYALIAGIDGLDESSLRLRFNEALLNPPPEVALQLENGVLYAQGAAEQDWIEELQASVDAFEEVTSVDIRALVNLTEVKLINSIAELEQQAVFFDVSTAFDFDSIDSPKLATLVKTIISESKKLSRQIQVVVRGYSDSVGSFEDNQFLSLERADYVAQALFNQGISPRYIVIKGLEAPVEKEKTIAEQRYNRRVSFRVNVE